MAQLKLIKEQNNVRLRAYMSSSLTSFPNLTKNEEKSKRENIQDLNRQIQVLCDKLKVDLYLPQESSNPSSNHDDGLSPDEVYLLDRWRVAESNFLIMNVSELSFGVGQEMEIANSMGIPTIVFIEDGKKLSRMIKGAPCIFIPPGYTPDQSIISYKANDISSLMDKLEDRIHILKEVISPLEEAKNPLESFGKKLKDIREGKNLSHKDLSERTGLSIKFLQLMEKEVTDLRNLGKEKKLNNNTFYDIDQNRFSNPGIWILDILAKGLNVNIGDFIPSLPDVGTLDGVDIYSEACKELDLNLVQFFDISKKLGFELQSNAAQNRFKTKEEATKFIKTNFLNK